MSQTSNDLLQHLRNEHQRNGKSTFSTQDILSYLNDPEEYSAAIDELIRYKSIARSKYLNCFDLLDP